MLPSSPPLPLRSSPPSESAPLPPLTSSFTFSLPASPISATSTSTSPSPFPFPSLFPFSAGRRSLKMHCVTDNTSSVETNPDSGCFLGDQGLAAIG
ncbi:hypothetical protein AHAS_Ahas19G0213100 [Arachis hypogaea]